MKLRCVIVDDEPLAREVLTRYVEAIDYLDLAGVAENPLELSKLLECEPVDLVFMDIQMPFMSGLDFLSVKTTVPMTILTTAFPDYALEGFQHGVVDYLLKPITFNRFFKATTKAKELYVLRNPHEAKTEAAEPDFVFIKCENRYEKIYLEDILFVQSLENYVSIHTEKTKHLTLLPLKTVEENLDGLRFIRVHKCYLVSVAKIERIENHELAIQHYRIPISRHFREKAMEEILKNRVWSK